MCQEQSDVQFLGGKVFPSLVMGKAISACQEAIEGTGTVQQAGNPFP